MANVSLVGISSAGGVITGGGQDFVKANGSDIAVIGDAVAPHGIGAHAAATMTQGSAFVKINGKAVCRAGDAASCGDTANGVSWLNITG